MLNSDSNAMVDRRIVVKLLVTYFQRNQSPEILELMARMLGLSGEHLPEEALCVYFTKLCFFIYCMYVRIPW